MDAIIIVTEKTLEEVKMKLSSVIGEFEIYGSHEPQIETDISNYLSGEQVAKKLGGNNSDNCQLQKREDFAVPDYWWKIVVFAGGCKSIFHEL